MKKRGLHIGLRTIKTALAIIIAMVAAGQFGGTSDKLIFAMLGLCPWWSPPLRTP